MSTLVERTEEALQDEFLRKAVRYTVERLTTAKKSGTEALGRWEDWREQARRVREHTIRHLDYYLATFVEQVEKNGAKVHFAKDAAEAVAISISLAKERGVTLAVKSKSMVSEELHLNQKMGAAGIECIETDLGEWIIQLANETPSHLILPAIHKSRGQIQTLFEAENGEKLGPETKVLAGYARRRLRQKFFEAGMGFTGCNFAIAETGTVVLFTNEGNGRMCTTLPKTHLVFMGMERILPGLADLELMANMLPRSATGQKLTTYMTMLSGPRREAEHDGAAEMHIIILDNGRSGQLGDPEFEAILSCIRCGACLNVCPVYRHAGGHAYGGTYSGPIGAVLTPLLQPDRSKWGELANASSLCGACHDACPVKIPLHDMLVHLRRQNVEKGLSGPMEKLAFKGYSIVFKSPRLYRAVTRVATGVQRALFGDGKRLRWLQKILPGMSGWTRGRDLPVPAPKSFRTLLAESEEGID